MIPGGAHAMAWPTLLIVDNDPEMLQALVCFFEKRGFHVAASATLAEAKIYLQRRKLWTLVISDYHLPDGTGLELFWWVREQVNAATPVLLMSGSVHGAALCAGVDYLAKPFPLTELEVRVRTLLRRMEN
jgi:DNA-binding response OmpR family regulator